MESRCVMKTGRVLGSLLVVMSCVCSCLRADIGIETRVAPVVWEASLPEGEMQVSQEMIVTLSFYFYEMPEVGVFDSVWIARVNIQGPEGTHTYQSELGPIVVGKREEFRVSHRIESNGEYVITAWILAVTAPDDWPAGGHRGSLFSYRTAYKVSRVSVLPLPLPDTGSRGLEGSDAQIRLSNIEEMGSLRPPGSTATVAKKRRGLKSTSAQLAGQVSAHHHLFRIRPYHVEPLNSIVLPEIKTRPGDTYVLEFQGVEVIDSTRLSDRALGAVAILNNNTLKLVAAGKTHAARLAVFCGDRVLHIFFNKSQSGFTVSGTFQFQTREGDWLPAAGMYAATYWRDIYMDYHLIDDGWTDASGYVWLFGDMDTSYFCLYARSTNATVYYCEDHSCEGEGMAISHGIALTISNPLHEDIYVGPPYSSITRPAWSGAFNVAREIMIAEDSLLDIVYPMFLPSEVPVIWDSACSDTFPSNYAGFTVGGTDAIFLTGVESSSGDPDEWDSPVIQHEYSHHIMAYYATIDPDAGGWHIYTAPAYTGLDTRWKSNLLAYSEGWANFFQGVLRGQSNYYDLGAVGDTLIYLEFEMPNPDVPFYLWWNQQQPSNTTPLFEGGMVEGAVTEALWDVYDLLDDGDYLVGGHVWGHNSDFNSTDFWSGIDYIWDVFWDFDPRPGDPDIDFCRTIYDFLHGWRSKGYPIDGRLTDIFEAHNVAVFVPGDADGNGIVNVSDAVYLIAYVFGGGPPPQPVPGGGDADGNCSVNISDATYVIDYVFYGGSYPLPGCA